MRILTISTISVLLAVSAFAGGKRKPIKMPDKVAPERDVFITPVLDTPLSSEKSTVWCATAQLAWDESVKLFKMPIKMVDQDRAVDILNNNPIEEGVIDPNFYYASAGWLKDGFYDKAMKDLKIKFGKDLRSVFPRPQSPYTVAIALSHLEAYLPFVRAFRKVNYPKPFTAENGKTTKVKWFGFTRKHAEKYESAGSLLRWKSEDDFILQLKTRIHGEKIVLAKMERPNSLKEAVEFVYSEKKEKKPEMRRVEVDGESKLEFFSIGPSDILLIPEINFKKKQNFDQLCNRKFLMEGFEERFISGSWQSVKFSMDHIGAALVSSSMDCYDDYGGSPPRKYIFDKPFLLMLWKDSAKLPYLAIWVNSEDILVPSKNTRKKR